MKIAIMSIGMPGAGKTTVLKPFAEKRGYAYLCPDDVREEIHGDAADRSNNADIWEKVRRCVLEQFSSHEVVVIDATFVDRRRVDFISFLKESGVDRVYGIVFEVPLESAKERNAQRVRKVAEHAIESKYRSLQEFPPLLADGFDALYSADQLSTLEEEIKKVL